MYLVTQKKGTVTAKPLVTLCEKLALAFQIEDEETDNIVVVDRLEDAAVQLGVEVSEIVIVEPE